MFQIIKIKHSSSDDPTFWLTRCHSVWYISHKISWTFSVSVHHYHTYVPFCAKYCKSKDTCSKKTRWITYAPVGSNEILQPYHKFKVTRSKLLVSKKRHVNSHKHVKYESPIIQFKSHAQVKVFKKNCQLSRYRS